MDLDQDFIPDIPAPSPADAATEAMAKRLEAVSYLQLARLRLTEAAEVAGVDGVDGVVHQHIKTAELWLHSANKTAERSLAGIMANPTR